MDKYARVRSDDDSRSSASEDEECDEESAPAPAGGDRGEVPAMRKASKLQPPLEEGKCRQRSPSPPHRRLRSQHSSESAARTCHPCAMRYDFVGRHENLESRPRPRPPRRRASVTWRRRDTATRRRRTRAACCSTSGPASNSPGSHPRMLARRFCGAVRSRPLQGPSAPSTR